MVNYKHNFANYLAGFIDGEGSFIIRFRKDQRYKTLIHIEPKINLTQKDKNVLELIKKKTGMGKIYFHKRDNLWYLNIYKIDDLIKMTSILNGKLIVKKKDLIAFQRCLKLISKKKHLTKKGLKIIFNLWTSPKTEVNA